MIRDIGVFTLDNFSNTGSLDSFTTNQKILKFDGLRVKYYTGEFWTPKQRQSSSLHEISYRACFKPQLPNFFIKRFTTKNSIIFDPFLGRGTTVVESVLNGRISFGMDVNPLSEILTYPRIHIQNPKNIFERLDSLNLDVKIENDLDLSMFYHHKTESEILNLKEYLLYRKESEEEDNIDKWIRMVATNRLTGHSSGFFSVYTLPPNQATNQKEQIRINEKKNQIPEYRDVKKIIKKKTLTLLKDISPLTIKQINEVGSKCDLLTEDASIASKYLDERSIKLTVTSPPFLNVVQYAKDNWLRFWFNGINLNDVEKKIFITSNVEKWSKFIRTVLKQLYIITEKGGYVAFEVGEVKSGTINLDEFVVLNGVDTGFEVEGVYINKQNFTKTSKIWGVDNLQKGTNTNRVVLLKRVN